MELDQEFIEEINQLIEKTKTLINQLKQFDEKNSDLNARQNKEGLFLEIIRYLNTIKGGCYLYNLTNVAGALDYFEHLVLDWQQTKKLPAEGILYLDQGLEHLHEVLNKNITFNYPLNFLSAAQKSYENHEADEIKMTAIESNNNQKKIQRHKKSHSIFTQAIEEYSNKNRLEIDFQSVLIYVVDDEAEIRNHIGKRLSLAGFKVKIFENAVNALEVIEQDQPDVIISDFSMPQIDGKEFLQKTRALKMAVPFIYVSAYLTKEKCIELLTLGAAGFVEKPFNINDIISLVQINATRHLSNKLLNQSLKFLIYQMSFLEYLPSDLIEQHQLDILKNELKNIIRLRNKALTEI